MDNTQRTGFSITLDAWLSNLSKTGRSRKQAVSVVVDITIVLFSLWAAYSLRHGMFFSDFRSTWYIYLALPLATVVIFMSLGIYRWVIRSSNSKLFRQIVKAAIVSALFLVLFSFLFPSDRVMPRSLFVIYGLLLGTGACGVRFLWQGIFDSGDSGEPVAIFGAGFAGRQLMHSLSHGQEYRPVLFLDDNKLLGGSTIAGLPVSIAGTPEMDNVLAGLEIEKVILAMPTIGPKEYQKKLDVFKSSGVPVLTVPTYSELVAGSAKPGQVRDISISDILGRNEVPLNPELMGKCISGKTLLVTGGGGSIGSELSRQIISLNPKKLVVLDQSEFNLYQITEEISRLISDTDAADSEFIPVLGTVNDTRQINELFSIHGFNTVFHAAAYKHVPVVEAQPEQGLQTNVFGTLNVLNEAINFKAENFVLISTDKAVRPTNSMGATKRIAELVLQAKAAANQTTKISMVRFGNVLGSSGSVVPKFKKQIEQGGPITLTDSAVTRFFMTIPEAAQLVLQASSIAKGGDVFVLDMGEPVRIEELAVAMVRLSGRRLKRDTGKDSDIELKVEGLRPGEKMYEELFITGSHQPTRVSKVFTAKEDWISWSKLKYELDSLKGLMQLADRTTLRKKLLDIAFLNFPNSTLNEKAVVSSEHDKVYAVSDYDEC